MFYDYGFVGSSGIQLKEDMVKKKKKSLNLLEKVKDRG